MSFFTLGNLLNLGVMVLAFIIYHQLNRRNRTLDRIREYGKRFMNDLSAFAEKKEQAVKDYAIDLDVEKQAAGELLKTLKTREGELGGMAESARTIGERIAIYDSAMAELDRETCRVQENLNRIREESSVVEGASKRIGAAEGRLKGLEKGLAGLEKEFERENAASLEKAADSLLASLRSEVSDLRVQAETVERQVEDHREAIGQAGRQREEAVARDLARVESVLKEALALAGDKADTLEDAALAKLRDQALERVQRFQTALEDKLKTYQETSKAQVAGIQSLLKAGKEAWKAEHAGMAAEQQALRDALKQDMAGLESLAKNTGEEWQRTAVEAEQQARTLLAGLEAAAQAQAEKISADTAGTGERVRTALADFEGRLNQVAGETEQRLAAEAAERENRIRAEMAQRDRALTVAAEERDERITAQMDERGASLEEAGRRISAEVSGLEARVAALKKELEQQAASATTGLEAQVSAAIKEAEGRVADASEDLMERLGALAEETGRRVSAEMAEREGAFREEITALNESLSAVAGEQDRQIRAALEFQAAGAEETRRRIAGSIAELEAQVNSLREQISGTASRIEPLLADTLADAENRAREASAGTLAQWQKTGDEAAERWRILVEQGNVQFNALETRLRGFEGKAGDSVGRLEAQLLQSIEGAEQRILEAAEARLEAYRAAQTEQFEGLSRLTEDAAQLDGELRIYMKDTEDRIRRDFARFEESSSRECAEVLSVFTGSQETLRKDLNQIEEELAGLKEQACEQVSEKIKLFEGDFTADLSRRSGEIDRRLDEWQTGMDAHLAALGEEAGEERRLLEQRLSEALKQRFAEQSDRLVADLEHLKAEAVAFEEGIRDQMAGGEESLQSFRTQLGRDLEEARGAAEASVKAELGRYSLSLAENLKQAQRDLSASLKELEDQVVSRSAELSSLEAASRKESDTWQAKTAAQNRETDALMDDLRRRVRETAAESEERLIQVRAAIEEVRTDADNRRTEIFGRLEDQSRELETVLNEEDRRIKEFIAQTKLFEKTEALKVELERHIEDYRSDISGLDQRRAEAAELESQFVKIKRLEDEVNAKMTRFLSEKRRIELMETDFNRLLQTSQAVEDKLGQISASDDILQTVQVEIRKLADALADAEDKYQRIEKKNQTLENTNEGIARNFTALQKSDAELKQLSLSLGELSGEQAGLRTLIDKLAGESERVKEATDKLSGLDGELSGIEERIEAVQKAREWIARAETRMEELNKDIHDQVKLMGAILKKEGGKPTDAGRGAPPIGTRENVLALARQGWAVKEIAQSLQLSLSEVELIIEIGNRGNR